MTHPKVHFNFMRFYHCLNPKNRSAISSPSVYHWQVLLMNIPSESFFTSFALTKPNKTAINRPSTFTCTQTHKELGWVKQPRGFIHGVAIHASFLQGNSTFPSWSHQLIKLVKKNLLLCHFRCASSEIKNSALPSPQVFTGKQFLWKIGRSSIDERIIWKSQISTYILKLN